MAARRRERAEAREIRLREIERQQKEMDEHSDKHYELLNNNGNVSGINNQIQNINNNNNNMDHIGSSYRMRTPIISREVSFFYVLRSYFHFISIHSESYFILYKFTKK